MLRQRVFTALIALSILAFVLFVLPGRFVPMIIAALMLAAAWEWAGFLRFANPQMRGVYTAIMAVLLLASWYWVPGVIAASTIFTVAFFWWVGAFIWLFFFQLEYLQLWAG